VSKKLFLIAWCAALAAAGCKQGLGDRCQVNSDCVSGICSESLPQVCVSITGQNDQIDASVPIDAPTDSP
jgi:hypothetical protein